MSNELSSLVLGWKVDENGHPRYWLRPDAHAGGHSDHDVVRIPAPKLARHTAIVAQSGSGKSFLLGRLIEEILLGTRAQTIIFDSNADFRRIHDLQADSVWEKAGYNPETFLGMLPTEADSGVFSETWRAMPKVVAHGGSLGDEGGYEQLRIWWPYLSVDILAQGLSPSECVQLRHCHEFVRSIAELFVEDCDVLLARSREVLEATRADGPRAGELRQCLLEALGEKYRSDEHDDMIHRASMATQFVSPDVATFYFARAREFEADCLLRSTPPPDHYTRLRSIVFDLPSILNREVRLSVVNQALVRLFSIARAEWEKAMALPPEEDRRVPRFIVVDEAHNLLPAQPQDQTSLAVRDLFRTITAEGRKYGLFLIAVSQRPDKLDPMILSECENKIIMHVDSTASLERLRGVLGTSQEEYELLQRCTSYRLGRGLLLGPWATGGAVEFMAAARRTREGGRNLREDWWARPDSP